MLRVNQTIGAQDSPLRVEDLETEQPIGKKVAKSPRAAKGTGTTVDTSSTPQSKSIKFCARK